MQMQQQPSASVSLGPVGRAAVAESPLLKWREWERLLFLGRLWRLLAMSAPSPSLLSPLLRVLLLPLEPLLRLLLLLLLLFACLLLVLALLCLELADFSAGVAAGCAGRPAGSTAKESLAPLLPHCTVSCSKGAEGGTAALPSKEKSMVGQSTNRESTCCSVAAAVRRSSASPLALSFFRVLLLLVRPRCCFLLFSLSRRLPRPGRVEREEACGWCCCFCFLSRSCCCFAKSSSAAEIE